MAGNTVQDPKTPKYLIMDKEGKLVMPGQTIKDFRGEEWSFKDVSRSGTRVLVTKNEEYEREFYPGVFDLQVLKQMDMDLAALHSRPQEFLKKELESMEKLRK